MPTTQAADMRALQRSYLASMAQAAAHRAMALQILQQGLALDVTTRQMESWTQLRNACQSLMQSKWCGEAKEWALLARTLK
jgi:hypothetical protein